MYYNYLHDATLSVTLSFPCFFYAFHCRGLKTVCLHQRSAFPKYIFAWLPDSKNWSHVHLSAKTQQTKHKGSFSKTMYGCLIFIQLIFFFWATYYVNGTFFHYIRWVRLVTACHHHQSNSSLLTSFPNGTLSLLANRAKDSCHTLDVFCENLL